MAANQYNYPPPPPPPPQHGPSPGYPQYQQSSYSQPPGRGGGRGRGRGGNFNQGNRGDFHASSPYNQHAAGYSGPAGMNGGYMQQNPAPYIGPQPAAGGYPPQWHEHQSSHPQMLQHQQAPPPVPLSAQNYHPNYAPQVYQQPPPPQQPQYGPQQPFQNSPPPNSFTQHVPPSQPAHAASQRWQGSPQHAPPSFNSPSHARGRGGHTQGRGGYEAPLMGPPIRMGFDSDRSAEPMPQASNGFPPSYPNSQQSPSIPYSQPAYSGYAQNFSHKGPRPSDPNSYSQNPYRGRGGAMNHRGRRDLNSGDRGRHRNIKNQHPPSFTVDQSQKPVTEGKKKKKKKRKTNTLGLTPKTEEYEESEEEDDADEEARLAASLLGSELAREPSDLAAYLQERRERYPTKARREAREAELAKRRQDVAEQSAREKAKAKHGKDGKHSTATTESKLAKQQRKAEKLRRQLEKAEKKVQDAMKAGMKRKRSNDDDGDDEGDMVDQVIARATGLNHDDSDDSSSDSSEYTSDSDSDDDSGPETQTSRPMAPVQIPPAKKLLLQRQCKYFSTGGTCGKKGKCRFVHDQAVRDAALREKELNGGRMTLAQRLVQNDKEKDDLMVLKSIKYLFENGLFNEPQASASTADLPSHTVHAYNGNGFA